MWRCQWQKAVRSAWRENLLHMYVYVYLHSGVHFTVLGKVRVLDCSQCCAAADSSLSLLRSLFLSLAFCVFSPTSLKLHIKIIESTSAETVRRKERGEQVINRQVRNQNAPALAKKINTLIKHFLVSAVGRCFRCPGQPLEPVIDGAYLAPLCRPVSECISECVGKYQVSLAEIGTASEKVNCLSVCLPVSASGRRLAHKCLSTDSWVNKAIFIHNHSNTLPHTLPHTGKQTPSFGYVKINFVWQQV